MTKMTFRFFNMDGSLDDSQYIVADVDDTNTITKMTLIHGAPATYAIVSFGIDDNPWINVNDRLPECESEFGGQYSIDVEVKLSDNETIMGGYCDVKRTSNGYGNWYAVKGKTVTHWRYIKEDTNA